MPIGVGGVAGRLPSSIFATLALPMVGLSSALNLPSVAFPTCNDFVRIRVDGLGAGLVVGRGTLVMTVGRGVRSPVSGRCGRIVPRSASRMIGMPMRKSRPDARPSERESAAYVRESSARDPGDADGGEMRDDEVDADVDIVRARGDGVVRAVDAAGEDVEDEDVEGDGRAMVEVVRERAGERAGVAGVERAGIDVAERDGVDTAGRAGLRAGVGGAVREVEVFVREDDATENVGEPTRWDWTVDAVRVVDIDGVR